MHKENFKLKGNWDKLEPQKTFKLQQGYRKT